MFPLSVLNIVRHIIIKQTKTYNSKTLNETKNRLNNDSQLLRNDVKLLINSVYQHYFYWFKWMELFVLFSIVLINEFWISVDGYSPANITLFSLLFGLSSIFLVYTRPYKNETKFLLPSKCLTNISLILFTIFLGNDSLVDSVWAGPIIISLFCLTFVSLLGAYGYLLINGAKLEQAKITKNRNLLNLLLKVLNGKPDAQKTMKFLQDNQIYNPEDLLEQAYIDKRCEINTAIKSLTDISSKDLYFELANPLFHVLSHPKLEDSEKQIFTRQSFADIKTSFTPTQIRTKK